MIACGLLLCGTLGVLLGEWNAGEERLSFQTGGPWSPSVNLDAGVVMVYGIGPNLPGTIQSWREHGYIIEVMTGVAWGHYQDYLNGTFDGSRHWDEAQMDRNGQLILHGGNKEIPYISPGRDYGRYLTTGVERALDAGAQAIYLEEPEFWAASGYEENFKREWKTYYGENWQPPDSSPDAQYRASKLKYFLYRRALAQVFQFAHDYGRQHGRVIPCYVATHSLLNYSHWRIISPEGSLSQIGVDGYIAQVWTGTARTPNIYEGRRKERTFETAYLEYGVTENLVRGSGRRLWYLNDPVEDDPNHSWTDYRSSWESTLTASLLHPEVWRYEVMPWPDRVFTGKYPVTSVATNRPVSESEQAPTGTGLGGILKARPGVERVSIPKPYETELQTVIHALSDLKQQVTEWQYSGTRGVGVLVSDSMMFQRADPDPSDPNLGSFYGLAMPLLKAGVPVEPVQLEEAASPGFLNSWRLLLLTYEGQKPPSRACHEALARWVKEGGALVVVDDDRDPYNAVREWWSTAPMAFHTPREHLFAELGLPPGATGLHRVGRGVVLYESASPAKLTWQRDGAKEVRDFARNAAKATHLRWEESNALVLRRGPYVIAAGLDEAATHEKSVELRGHFVDLFDAGLPILTDAKVEPGRRLLLLDTGAIHTNGPLCSPRRAASWTNGRAQTICNL